QRALPADLACALVGVAGRLLLACRDPLACLRAGAAVTERARLVTMVVIGPIRNTALLAKQAATVDALSGGRLVLGLGLGARNDDYEAAGVDPRRRGKDFTRQLVELRQVWEDRVVGPRPAQPDGPVLLVGGGGGAAFTRGARHADGYVHGGGPPRAFAGAAARVRAAWIDAGRPGDPQLWGQAYFVLGDSKAMAAAAEYLRDYYRFTGGFEERIVAG